MAYIFLIAAEHQLTQVKIAIDFFKVASKQVFLIVLKIGNTDYIDRILNDNYFRNITYVFDNWVFKDLFLNRSIIVSYINFCKKLKKEHDEYFFFTSHYDSDPDLLLAAIIKPKQYFLMDEGTASFSVLKKRQLKVKQTIQYLIKSFIYGYRINLPNKITYFSQYHLDKHQNDSIVNYVLPKALNPLKVLLRQECIFIGSSIVEVGLISLSNYLFFIKKIHFDMGNKKITYFAHRKESLEKLKMIERMGFSIEVNKEPFENQFARWIECPATISSFFVTGVLDNIAKSNEKIPELKVYKFDTKLIIKDGEVYEAIYKDMANNLRLKFITLS
jgi:hypothetical protein